MDPQQQQSEPVPTQPPAPSPLPPAPTPENPQPVQQPETPPQNQQTPPPFHAEQQQAEPDHESESQTQVISWEASESIHHEKDALWFVGVLAISALLCVLSIFVLKSWSFTLLIVVMAVALIVFAKRPPRVMQYKLSEQGIEVNERFHPFTEFRAFGIVQDGPFHYITLLPIKRFMPAMDVYFPEEYGEDIVDLLGSKIPMQTIKPDMLDAVTKRLRL
jgi:hypothetical protein